jgi:hypothetical protein
MVHQNARVMEQIRIDCATSVAIEVHKPASDIVAAMDLALLVAHHELIHQPE